MATKLTIKQLSTLTGISQTELINLLKEKGVTVEADQALTPDQIQIIKEIKKRDKVSVKASSPTAKPKASGQTVITRLKSSDSKTKLTLSKTISQKITTPKKIQPTPAETEKPVAEENVA